MIASSGLMDSHFRHLLGLSGLESGPGLAALLLGSCSEAGLLLLSPSACIAPSPDPFRCIVSEDLGLIVPAAGAAAAAAALMRGMSPCSCCSTGSNSTTVFGPGAFVIKPLVMS